jgi:glycosyltransferase involved in cell wall biosynthesis
VTGLRRARVTTDVLVMNERASSAALRRTDASVIVVDTVAAAAATPHLAALRKRGKRIVAVALMTKGALALARHADRVIACSDALARELHARGVPRSRTVVVRPGRDPLPAQSVSANGKLRILCVANWSRAKGIHTLLGATRGIPGVVVDLVGDAPDDRYARRVRRLAAHHGDRVRIRGPLRGAALARRYARATIFALPSTSEAYGMAVAQALAFGLPVVACDIPATREVAGRAAILVPPNDGPALRDALRRLATSERRRAAMGMRARARARRLPTWVTMEVGILEVVEELLAA